MSDVRLTATNPVDSSVVPVSCNAAGELLVAKPVINEIDNDLTVNGSATFAGSVSADDAILANRTGSELGAFVASHNGTAKAVVTAGGSAIFDGAVDARFVRVDRSGTTDTILEGKLNGTRTVFIQGDGAAVFSGNVTAPNINAFVRVLRERVSTSESVEEMRNSLLVALEEL